MHTPGTDYHDARGLGVHPAARVERLHDGRDLAEEPRLGALVGDVDEAVVRAAGLVRELDARVLDGDTLHLREGQFPFQLEPVRPKRQDFRGRE